MLRTLGALRDPRMWGVIAVGISLRVGFEWGFGRHFEKAFEERDERLSHLSPEERMDEELRTMGRISTELLGVDVEGDVEAAIAEQHRAQEDLRRALEEAGSIRPEGDRYRDVLGRTPARPLVAPGTLGPGGLVLGPDGRVVKTQLQVGVHEERGLPVPAWLAAGVAGLLIAGAGVVISAMLLRASSPPEREGVAVRRAGADGEPSPTSAQAPG